MQIEFPTFMQTGLIRGYAKAFGCKLEEAEKPISEYPSLSAFFTRNLKAGTRPIIDDPQYSLVCPVDGRVVHYGLVEQGGRIEQCKGIDFPLRDFLGDHSGIYTVLQKQKNGENISAINGLEKKLYYAVIYLAPGDYHGYHSPTDWVIKERTHFPGYLYPVADWAVHYIRGLFSVNERVVLSGEWKHGFFAYTPIGAYNVGSMSLAFEKEFKTNVAGQRGNGPLEIRKYRDPVEISKGENVGFFNFGSSVVIIFESTPVLFMVPKGAKVKLGQPLTKELDRKGLEEHEAKLKERQIQIDEELIREYEKRQAAKAAILGAGPKAPAQ